MLSNYAHAYVLLGWHFNTGRWGGIGVVAGPLTVSACAPTLPQASLKQGDRMKRLSLAAAIVAGAFAAQGDDYQEAWGPPTGSEMLPINAVDQHGVARDLANLSGANGVLLFAFRSADW